jgi:hypothetical protein
MKNFLKSYPLLLLLFLTGCSEDEDTNPKVETVTVTATSASDLNVKAEILEIGSFKVIDFGIIYGYNNFLDVSSPTKISLGSSPTKGIFESKVALRELDPYYQNANIFVRVYLTNEKGTVYGETLSVVLPTLRAESVTPLQAKQNDIITIIGKNFSESTSGNKVKFNEVAAEVVEATATMLKVRVPHNITQNYYYNDYIRIYVNVGYQTVLATESFKLLPSATEFSPTSGSFGTLITVYGSNFNSYSTSIIVGDWNAAIQAITNSSVSFRIPPNVTSEKLKISVISNGVTIVLPGEFTIESPTISSFTPDTGISSTIVTLLGTNFNLGDYYYQPNLVKFNEVNASIVSVNAAELKVSVPAGLAQGKYKITLSTGVHTITAPGEFTLASPLIESFSPETAFGGTYVTITGSNFGNQDYYNGSVLFGQTSASIYSWNNNVIQVVVPSYIEPGSYAITVNTGGQSVTSDNEFVVK